MKQKIRKKRPQPPRWWGMIVIIVGGVKIEMVAAVVKF